MDTRDIPYLLKRACFHRAMARAARCVEARCIHHQFVRRYQRLLLEMRLARNPALLRSRELLAA